MGEFAGERRGVSETPRRPQARRPIDGRNGQYSEFCLKGEYRGVAQKRPNPHLSKTTKIQTTRIWESLGKPATFNDQGITKVEGCGPGWDSKKRPVRRYFLVVYISYDYMGPQHALMDCDARPRGPCIRRSRIQTYDKSRMHLDEVNRSHACRSPTRPPPTGGSTCRLQLRGRLRLRLRLRFRLSRRHDQGRPLCRLPGRLLGRCSP